MHHSAIYQWRGNNAPDQSNYSSTSPTVSVLATSVSKSTYQYRARVNMCVPLQLRVNRV